jgi:GTP cyclohydrolase FolE2
MSDQLYRSLRVHKAKAPVSGAKALMDYDYFFSAEMNGAHEDFVLGVRVPITTLCPCSKAISDYGSHNQRLFRCTRQTHWRNALNTSRE